MAHTGPHPIDAQDPRTESTPPTKTGRGLSITVGILFIIAGFFSMAFPFLSSLAATLVIGWLLVFVGGVSIVHAFSAGGWRGALWYGLVGVVFLIGGGLLIAAPVAGTFSLTALLASILIIEGIVEIIGAFAMRDRSSWGWVLVSGIVAFVAGVAIALQLPTSAFWVLGFLVGLNLIFSGVSYIMDPYDDHTVLPPKAS